MPLPGHPLYGKRVIIRQRRSSQTAIYCLIEDPDHPPFNYQLSQRWLHSEPPPEQASISPCPQAVAVSLVALDQLCQLLLVYDSISTIKDDEPHPLSPPDSDLEATAEKP